MGLLDKLRRRPAADDLPPPTYSNDSVIGRISEEEGVDRTTARGWFHEMLIFLDLCAKSDQVLSPPPNVDKAWHAFLLHSRDYEAYCLERFGRLIHHQPSGEPDSQAYVRAYRQRSAYRSSTGVDPMVWGVPTGIAIGDGDRDGGDRGDRGGDSAGGDWAGGDSGGSSGDSGGSSGDSGGGSSCGSSCGGSS